MRFGIVVPTRNPGMAWDSWIDAINIQSEKPDAILIIDSSSEDDTVLKSKNAGFLVRSIPQSDFNHGQTRQFGAQQLSEAEVVVYFTQDSLPANMDTLKNIVSVFNDFRIGVAYGRQLPRQGAGLIESHARYFNYTSVSEVKSLDDRFRLGMKTVFSSNSFAAYRVRALAEMGGFPSDVIVSEDMFVAAKMLNNGWNIAYCADACVYHSHGYSLIQEFKRYFDIGVFNAREPWIRQEYGGAESEGFKFIKSELRYLLINNPYKIPESLIRTILKMLGYRLGIMEKYLPLYVKKALSMQKGYWSQ